MSRVSSQKLPPGPKPVRTVSLGRARNLYGYISGPLEWVGGRFAEYGDTYLARTGDEQLYAFRHPDHLKAVLVDQADAFVKAEFGLEKVLGSGLLTSEGKLWKSRRRTIQPAFNKKRIESYGAAMVEETEARVATWKEGQRFDAAAEAMRITLNIVARTLFSHSVSDASGEADHVAEAMSSFQDSIGVFDLMPDWLPTPKHRRTKAAIDAMNDLIYGVIDARQRERAAGTHKQDDLLDALLDAVDPEASLDADDGRLNRVALRDELITLFMAGHETTANGLSWAWYFLARNPEVLAHLTAELDANIKSDTPLMVADLAQLPYLAAVCNETLRHRPPAYVLARKATREVQIGEWTLPKGAAVVLWTYMTQHDERWWPEPDRFDPERFLGDTPASRPKNVFMPFGGGARMCIGKHFALMEMQLLLGTIVRRVQPALQSDEEISPKPRITLTPGGGVPAVVRRR